jgi:hypothetical protein
MAVLKYYNTATSAWEYIAASTTANFTTWKKTMAGGETSVSGTDDNAVTLSYTVGLEQVFINGVLQVRGSDYTATTGTSVTGLTALVAGDIVTVVCYAPFNIANTIAPTLVDAKGDLLVGTGADAVGRLAVGSSDVAFLRADSTASTGLKWDNDAWTTWTPTLSDITVGNGTVSAAYKQIGKTVFWEFRLVFGSTTSVTGGNSFLNLPVTGKRIVSKSMVGQMIDANGSIYPSIGYWIGESGFYFGVINASGTYGTLTQMSSTVPFTWTTSDSITYSGVYEAA